MKIKLKVSRLYKKDSNVIKLHYIFSKDNEFTDIIDIITKDSGNIYELVTTINESNCYFKCKYELDDGNIIEDNNILYIDKYVDNRNSINKYITIPKINISDNDLTYNTLEVYVDNVEYLYGNINIDKTEMVFEDSSNIPYNEEIFYRNVNDIYINIDEFKDYDKSLNLLCFRKHNGSIKSSYSKEIILPRSKDNIIAEYNKVKLTSDYIFKNKVNAYRIDTNLFIADEYSITIIDLESNNIMSKIKSRELTFTINGLDDRYEVGKRYLCKIELNTGDIFNIPLYCKYLGIEDIYDCKVKFSNKQLKRLNISNSISTNDKIRIIDDIIPIIKNGTDIVFNKVIDFNSDIIDVYELPNKYKLDSGRVSDISYNVHRLTNNDIVLVYTNSDDTRYVYLEYLTFNFNTNKLISRSSRTIFVDIPFPDTPNLIFKGNGIIEFIHPNQNSNSSPTIYKYNEDGTYTTINTNLPGNTSNAQLYMLNGNRYIVKHKNEYINFSILDNRGNVITTNQDESLSGINDKNIDIVCFNDTFLVNVLSDDFKTYKFNNYNYELIYTSQDKKLNTTIDNDGNLYQII